MGTETTGRLKIMKKIVFIKDYKGYGAGEKIEIDNNTAFSLIDTGVAVLSKFYRDYENKMMSFDKKRGYKVK